MDRRYPHDPRLDGLRILEALKALEAEGTGRSEEAEASLAALFEALPRPGPRPGFADRVLARVRHRPLFARPAARLAVAASLLAVAIGTALLAPAIGPLLALVGPADLLGAAVEAATGLAGRLAAGVVAWRDAGATAQALARAIVHPAILILLVAQFAVASLALRALAGLSVTTQRRGVPHAVS